MRDTVVFMKDLTEKNGKFYIDLELDPEELQAIGHIAAQWAFLEYHIFEYTKAVCEVASIDLPKEAESDSLRKRMQTWGIVVRAYFPAGSDELAAILKIIGRATSLSGRRHKLVHGYIKWNIKDKESLDVYSRKNPRGIPWNINAAKIEAFAREISTLNADFLNVHNEYPQIPNYGHGTASPSRRGIPVPAEIPPEFATPLESIPGARKPPKQSSGD